MTLFRQPPEEGYFLVCFPLILKKMNGCCNNPELTQECSELLCSDVHTDSKGNPRNVTNSKGKKRRPNSKDLASILKTNDPLFLDFIKRCLVYVYSRLTSRYGMFK